MAIVVGDVWMVTQKQMMINVFHASHVMLAISNSSALQKNQESVYHAIISQTIHFMSKNVNGTVLRDFFALTNSVFYVRNVQMDFTLIIVVAKMKVCVKLASFSWKTRYSPPVVTIMQVVAMRSAHKKCTKMD